MSNSYDQLPYICSHDELKLYELIPNIVWIFDIDRHGWWWGNAAALTFWDLETIEDLIAKDLSGDTQGARDRTLQTFELAVKNGLTTDIWTTYPNGKPKTLQMMHKAVTIGPDKHRAIIAFINEAVDLGSEPENLLLVEAMRYTTVLVTSFTQDGEVVTENPSATEAYKHLNNKTMPSGVTTFSSRFMDPEQGELCRQNALKDQGGRWDYSMKTGRGVRKHTLDIRITRHPLSGEFLLLVVEYDVTDLYDALSSAELTREQLRQIAHYDTLTGLSSLHMMKEKSAQLLRQAAIDKQRLSVMFIDLDNFKKVNDSFGHDTGDQVLKRVAERLQNVLGKSNFLARLGGDEFVALQVDVEELLTDELARKTVESLSKPFIIGNTKVYIGASVGVAFYPDHGHDLEALLKVADQSMYKVKRSGKNSFYFATEQLSHS